MNYWNEIYSKFSSVAFYILDFGVHWYALAYIGSLLMALFLAHFFSKRMRRFKHLNSKIIDSYFIWVELGIIIGARFGYLFIYTDEQVYYLTNPWQAFNPFVDGVFTGIAGMSYHGAVFGFLIASFLFSYFKKINILSLLDLVAISLPLAYTLGRIGNFLNKELYGRVIENESLKFIGIYVEGGLRYPSQLIEAFLEGIILFFIILFVAFKKESRGYLIVAYSIGYGITRFIAEFSRQPDIQMGYYFFDLTMGQILSIVMILVGVLLYFYIIKLEKTMNKISKKSPK